jgi:hypothetical protein
MPKVGTFEGRNVDPQRLYGNLKKMLITEGFGIAKDEPTANSYDFRAITNWQRHNLQEEAHFLLLSSQRPLCNKRFKWRGRDSIKR